MAIKTTYKLSKLARRVEEELAFYLKEFNKILEEYAKKNNGEYVLSDDGTSIMIIEGKEVECKQKISELQNLEIDLSDFNFSIEEFENLDITLAQFDLIYPLINN